MPFDTAILGDDFMPMNHKTIQPVSAEALKCYDEKGREIPGYHHIVRGDNGDTIRIAPESYTVVQNAEMIEMIEGAFAKSKLDLTDARFGVDYSSDGARMFAQWLFPAHTAVVKPGVEASLRVVALNAYDGSTALQGRVGNFNWVCANSAVSGKEFASFRFVHSGKIDLAPAVAKLAIAAEQHVEEVRRWERWPAIEVTDTQARKLISSLPKASGTLIDSLVHDWLRARDEDPIQGGPNLWCLYNVLTRWATHSDEGENRALRVWEKQDRVADTIEGKVWQDVEAV